MRDAHLSVDAGCFPGVLIHPLRTERCLVQRKPAGIEMQVLTDGSQAYVHPKVRGEEVGIREFPTAC